MSKINDGGPAFPTDAYYDEKRYGVHDGMTLRDYFAAKAASGAADHLCDLLGEKPGATINGIPVADVLERELERHAKAAYMVADAMLKARAG